MHTKHLPVLQNVQHMRQPSRRSILSGVGMAAAGGLAGCLTARRNDTSGTDNDDLGGEPGVETSLIVRNEDDMTYTVTAVVQRDGESIRESSTLSVEGTTREIGVGSLRSRRYTLTIRLDSGKSARSGWSIGEDNPQTMTVVIGENGEIRFRSYN